MGFPMIGQGCSTLRNHRTPLNQYLNLFKIHFVLRLCDITTSRSPEMLPRPKDSSKISCQENSRVSLKQLIIFESTYMFSTKKVKLNIAWVRMKSCLDLNQWALTLKLPLVIFVGYPRSIFRSLVSKEKPCEAFPDYCFGNIWDLGQKSW